MRRIQILLSVVFICFLAGCFTPEKDIALQPPARDILLPEELPESLAGEQIYWQGHLVYLNGQPVMENDPVRQLWDETNIESAPTPKFSHNKHYMLYRATLGANILIWDLETNEKKWLIEPGIDLPAGAKINGMAFMPNDDKVIFTYTWGGENQPTYSDLALVDIESGQVESLNIIGFLSDYFEISVSPDGKWAVTGMVTQNNRVCFLVNLEMRKVECLNGEKGWYSSAMFLPDLEHIVYSHHKEIMSPATIMLSRIDGTEDRVLVSGLIGGEILVVPSYEIIFVGRTYSNPACWQVYIINQDGSDLRKLAYLGEECITDEGAPVVS